MVVMTEMPLDHKPAGLRPHKDPSWPSLNGGDTDIPTSDATDPVTGAAGAEEWGEFQDTEHGSADEEEKNGGPKIPPKPNPKILHRCASTPDFGFNDEYSQSSESSAGPEADEDEQKTEDGAAGPTPAEASPGSAAVVTPSAKPAGGSAWGPNAKGGVRRTPSFAEMVKANAEASAEEEAKRAAHLEATAERLRKEREARRKARARHMKLVVTPIKRCSKSTGDLQSLSKIHESAEHEDDYGGGGGGGGGFGGIEEHHEEEVLGDTDAMEFYHRKAKGAQNRVSGKMIRPDEAKRKEISVNKREAQRQKQQAAQAAKGGGGGKSKSSGAEKVAGKGGKGKGGKKR